MQPPCCCPNSHCRFYPTGRRFQFYCHSAEVRPTVTKLSLNYIINPNIFLARTFIKWMPGLQQTRDQNLRARHRIQANNFRGCFTSFFTVCFEVKVVILEETVYFTPNQTRIRCNEKCKRAQCAMRGPDRCKSPCNIGCRGPVGVCECLKGVLGMASPNYPERVCDLIIRF